MRGFADGYRHGIGALADRSVSSTRTIKHQEELEFIKSGDRSSGGSRLYREDVERLEQILGERHGVHSTHEQRALAIRDVAKEADKVVVLNEVVKHLEEQEQQVDDKKIRKRREELGYAEDLLRNLRRDVALCKECVREIEKFDPPLTRTS